MGPSSINEVQYSNISLRGIQTNNLKSVDISIEHGEITAIVGGSGAGKTSLAFHTLYALCRNELDVISGVASSRAPKLHDYRNLLPAVALKQKNTNTNPRSSIFTYLGLDKLLFPLFLWENPSLRRNILTPNNPSNYCETCEGIGHTYVPDEERIADLYKPLSENPFLSWERFASGHYDVLLKKVCDEHLIPMHLPLVKLKKKQRNFLLYGLDNTSYTVSYKQGKRYRRKAFTFVGAIREIQECCDNLQVPGNHQKAQSYIKEAMCPKCGGARFSSHLTQYTLNRWTIKDILLADFDSLLLFIEGISQDDGYSRRLLRIISNVVRNNLGYLSPMRSIPSLSGGEFQRLQLSSVLSSEFSNLLYVLDEVSSSLHVSEYSDIISQLGCLRDKKSTLVLVEHSLEFIDKSSSIIALNNGEIINSSNWLEDQKKVLIDRKRVSPGDRISCLVQNIHNIKRVDIDIPQGCLVGCCGVSGSGKSTFSQSIAKQEGIDYISQGTIYGNSNSTVATYLKLMQPIDALLAKELNVKTKTFLFNNIESQCSFCEGKGRITQEASFGHIYNSECEACEGRRYNPEVLRYQYRNMSIHDILICTVEELLELDIFKDSSRIVGKLGDMRSIGLGHLTLFRATGELSGGEAQRIKLLAKMKSKLKNTFLIIDEPAKGLERNDVKRLVSFFDKLLPKTRGIMLVEHNILLLESMDHIVEFGPCGGNEGGRVIFQGSIAESLGPDSGSIIGPYFKG